MSNEACETCGAKSVPLGTGSTALEQHVLDHSDPHQTLDLVPKVTLGSVPPSSTSGHIAGDWYVDVTSRIIWTCRSSNVGSSTVLSWVQASATPAVTQAQLTSALASYVTSSALSAALAGYVPSTSMSLYATQSQLSGYVTHLSLQTSLASYVTSSALSSAGYVTSSQLSTALAGYASASSLNDGLATRLTQTAADARYALKSDVSGLLSQSDVSGIVAGRVFRQPTQAGTYPELDLDVVLGSYLTSSAAASAYLTKTSAAATYVTASQLAAAILPLATSASVDSTLGSYLTGSEAAATYLTQASAASTYVTSQALSSALSDYATSDDLEDAVDGFITQTAADARYALSTALSSYVTSSVLSSTLSGYATTSALSSAVGGLVDRNTADATYVSQTSLSGMGYLTAQSTHFQKYVYRNPTNGVYPEMNLDTILSALPVSSVTAGNGKPVTSGAVAARFATSDALIASTAAGLQTQITNLTITGGQSNLLKQITAATTVGSVKYLLTTNNASNYVLATSAYTLLSNSNQLRFLLPAAVNGVARDCMLTVDFTRSGYTGQVPYTMQLKTYTGGASVLTPTLYSHMANPFDMTGITYGSVVCWSFTEIGGAVFAVSRRVLYLVT